MSKSTNEQSRLLLNTTPDSRRIIERLLKQTGKKTVASLLRVVFGHYLELYQRTSEGEKIELNDPQGNAVFITIPLEWPSNLEGDVSGHRKPFGVRQPIDIRIDSSLKESLQKIVDAGAAPSLTGLLNSALEVFIECSAHYAAGYTFLVPPKDHLWYNPIHPSEVSSAESKLVKSTNDPIEVEICSSSSPYLSKHKIPKSEDVTIDHILTQERSLPPGSCVTLNVDRPLLLLDGTLVEDDLWVPNLKKGITIKTVVRRKVDWLELREALEKISKKVKWPDLPKDEMYRLVHMAHNDPRFTAFHDNLPPSPVWLLVLGIPQFTDITNEVQFDVFKKVQNMNKSRWFHYEPSGEESEPQFFKVFRLDGIEEAYGRKLAQDEIDEELEEFQEGLKIYKDSVEKAMQEGREKWHHIFLDSLEGGVPLSFGIIESVAEQMESQNIAASNFSGNEIGDLHEEANNGSGI